MSPYGRSLKAHWFQILLSLADRDLHGSAIMEEVLERTDGEMKLWPGTLYGTLKQMTTKGLISEIEAPDGAPSDRGKRRFYSIASEGRSVLRDEVDHLADLVRVARSKRVSDDFGTA